MNRNGRAAAFWGRALGWMVFTSVIWNILNPCRVPVGEKMLASDQAGAADFRPLYEATRGGKPVAWGGALPPGLAALYPLRWLFGDQTDRAADAWFFLDLVFLGVLAAIAFSLCRDLATAAHPANVPAFAWALLIPLSFPAMVALDRGSVAIPQSTLLWAAIGCAARERPRAAAALAVWGGSIALPGLGLGVFLLLYLLTLPGRGKTVSAAGLAAGFLILCRPELWAEAIGDAIRTDVIPAASSWRNCGGGYLLHSLGIAAGGPIRCLLAAGLLGLALWRCRRARRAAPAQALPELVSGAVLCIAAGLACRSAADPDALLPLLPGLLPLIVTFDSRLAGARLGPRALHGAGLGAGIGAVLLGCPDCLGSRFPAAAIGVFLLIALNLSLLSRADLRAGQILQQRLLRRHFSRRGERAAEAG
jgi:hypothetical protein